MYLSDEHDKIYRALVSLAIEKSLLGIYQGMYQQVLHLLNTKYNCDIQDCYYHPEYLTGVLEEIFGDTRKFVVKSIRQDLKEFKNNRSIEKFLDTIN